MVLWVLLLLSLVFLYCNVADCIHCLQTSRVFRWTTVLGIIGYMLLVLDWEVLGPDALREMLWLMGWFAPEISMLVLMLWAIGRSFRQPARTNWPTP
jgi:hypothetical protein